MANLEDFVCQTIEEVLNRQHLSLNPSCNNIKSILSGARGIYFLWGKRKNLVYIGQSSNIKDRLHSHSVYDGTQLISFIRIFDKATRLEIEKGLIFALRPIANGLITAHYGIGVRYDNLVRRMKRRRYIQLRLV